MDNISLSYFDTAIIYQIDYINFIYIRFNTIFLFHFSPSTDERHLKLLHGALTF